MDLKLFVYLICVMILVLEAKAQYSSYYGGNYNNYGGYGSYGADPGYGYTNEENQGYYGNGRVAQRRNKRGYNGNNGYNNNYINGYDDGYNNNNGYEDKYYRRDRRSGIEEQMRLMAIRRKRELQKRKEEKRRRKLEQKRREQEEKRRRKLEQKRREQEEKRKREEEQRRKKNKEEEERKRKRREEEQRRKEEEQRRREEEQRKKKQKEEEKKKKEEERKKLLENKTAQKIKEKLRDKFDRVDSSEAVDQLRREQEKELAKDEERIVKIKSKILEDTLTKILEQDEKERQLKKKLKREKEKETDKKIRQLEKQIDAKFEAGYKNASQTCHSNNRNIYKLIERALACVQSNPSHLATLSSAISSFNGDRSSHRYKRFKASISSFYRKGRCHDGSTRLPTPSPTPAPASSKYDDSIVTPSTDKKTPSPTPYQSSRLPSSSNSTNATGYTVDKQGDLLIEGLKKEIRTDVLTQAKIAKEKATKRSKYDDEDD